MQTLRVDLNYSNGNNEGINAILEQTFQHIVDQKIREVEIKVSRQDSQSLKKIERFLRQPLVAQHYQRMDNAIKKNGTVTLYFKY